MKYCIDCGKRINKKSERCKSCSNRYRIRDSHKTDLLRKMGYRHLNKMNQKRKLREIFKNRIKDIEMIKGGINY